MAYDESTARFYYLNKAGTKGVKIDKNGKRERLPVSFDGITVKQVSVMYWVQCGNFSFPVVRRGKKLIAVHPDSEVETTKWMPFEVRHPNISLPTP